MVRAPSRPLFDGIYPSAISIGKGALPNIDLRHT